MNKGRPQEATIACANEIWSPHCLCKSFSPLQSSTSITIPINANAKAPKFHLFVCFYGMNAFWDWNRADCLRLTGAESAPKIFFNVVKLWLSRRENNWITYYTEIRSIFVTVAITFNGLFESKSISRQHYMQFAKSIKCELWDCSSINWITNSTCRCWIMLWGLLSNKENSQRWKATAEGENKIINKKTTNEMNTFSVPWGRWLGHSSTH